MFDESLTRLPFPRLFRDLYISAASVGFEAFWPKFFSVLSCNFISSCTEEKIKCESSRLNLVKLSVKFV